MGRTSQKSVSKYIKNNYDVFRITMRKGSKGIIKEIAENNGISINAFIQKAVEEKLIKEGYNPLESLKSNDYFINSRDKEKSNTETETDSETETNQD